jgi:ATP-dependent Clp protease ATP-binding subunit ClpC
MFERFTDKARRVIVMAQEQARLLDHDYIGTEHLLLGLLAVDDAVAAKALKALDVSLAATAAEVEELIGRGDKAAGGHIPFTPRAKSVLEHSLRSALELNHNYIGTEHILLGLLAEPDGVAGTVLFKKEGITVEAVRAKVTELLEAYRAPEDPA